MPLKSFRVGRMSKISKVAKLLSPMAREVERTFDEFTIQGDNWIIVLFELESSIRIVIHRTILVADFDFAPYKPLRGYVEFIQFKDNELKLERSYRSFLTLERLRIIYEVTSLVIPASLSVREILQVIFAFL